ncbi:ELM2 and Myb SANT-like domain containing 1 [Cichlidogyrus casuarinus]|uniref:ELM2 and Myb SANT-like domain containing 1 n=1 Tax=Cichlidogyrus casuarinus TaxID=1844966 RepID=A0ABD2QLP7_9PLAT
MKNMGDVNNLKSQNTSLPPPTGPVKRSKRKPAPLYIAPQVTGNQSRLRAHRQFPSTSSAILVDNNQLPPYTPPPMLSPNRKGSGLFHTVARQSSQRRRRFLAGGVMSAHPGQLRRQSIPAFTDCPNSAVNESTPNSSSYTREMMSSSGRYGCRNYSWRPSTAFGGQMETQVLPAEAEQGAWGPPIFPMEAQPEGSMMSSSGQSTNPAVDYSEVGGYYANYNSYYWSDHHAQSNRVPTTPKSAPVSDTRCHFDFDSEAVESFNFQSVQPEPNPLFSFDTDETNPRKRSFSTIHTPPHEELGSYDEEINVEDDMEEGVVCNSTPSVLTH